MLGKLIFFFLVAPIVSLSAQVKLKTIDPTFLDGKVLYIPHFDAGYPELTSWNLHESDSPHTKEEFISLWTKTMEESSWDITPYEIKEFDEDILLDNKDPNALILNFSSLYTVGKKSSGYDHKIKVIATGPQKRVLASVLINDLDLWESTDLRIVINMLSHSINQGMKAYDEGEGSSKSGVEDLRKQFFVDFMTDVKSKTFLVVRNAPREEEHLKELADGSLKKWEIKYINQLYEKNLETDAKVQDALESKWEISPFKMIYKDELVEFRDELNTDYFYWMNMEKKALDTGLEVKNRNYIFSTDGDKVFVSFSGKKELKASTITAIQTKLLSRFERNKNELKNNAK